MGGSKHVAKVTRTDGRISNLDRDKARPTSMQNQHLPQYVIALYDELLHETKIYEIW